MSKLTLTKNIWGDAMLEIFNIFIAGIASFVISGIDDLLLMSIIYFYSSKAFYSGTIGILIALIFLIIFSFMLGIFYDVILYKTFHLEYIRYIHYFIGIYLVYLVMKFVYNIKNKTKKIDNPLFSKDDLFKTAKTAGVIYVIQGLDDLIIYSGMFMKFISEDRFDLIIPYILGIIIGLLVFYVLVLIMGHKIKRFLIKRGVYHEW